VGCSLAKGGEVFTEIRAASLAITRTNFLSGASRPFAELKYIIQILNPVSSDKVKGKVVPVFNYLLSTTPRRRHAVAQLVEALCYKLEGSGFDS
jgi:hypothetical protein